MKKIVFDRLFLLLLCLTMLSCTKEKTDYEAEIATDVTEHVDFKEAYAFKSDTYTISIEALNGTFYTGYNEIRLKITNSRTGAAVDATSVTFLPLTTTTDGSQASCPHRRQLTTHASGSYFSGYVVYTHDSTKDRNWVVSISFTLGGQRFQVEQSVNVQEQKNNNLNMTAFTGEDQEQYIIALVSPQKPRIGENALVAGIYRYHKPSTPLATSPLDTSRFSYSEVNDYQLQLDPRMPEPSMGNHSSPNNRDLVQGEDGLYHGVVNYTMTGNWTLNFILLNAQGRVLKGTVVPADFTPGVHGVKSELFIDTLF